MRILEMVMLKFVICHLQNINVNKYNNNTDMMEI